MPECRNRRGDAELINQLGNGAEVNETRPEQTEKESEQTNEEPRQRSGETEKLRRLEYTAVDSDQAELDTGSDNIQD